ncbi:hypothetical protein NC797_09820 [Aquibacillus sp. 3ASR75-11]|uniref:Uncharacterized protein n=1 Tax=Terrihalobacillus insolitus TaxID=2950438 RepID=A0A9X4ALW5_9BACI|nr:hypothetical protein [Terrihalobacillus insolitus]MDC3413065.1 hypothetical protein [Terrihalobacillus insolitus]MDC3424807.1 hypothetical protein [Terrihalobacillus insolitus]
MDGLLFYWISWLMWIIITFLMPKRKTRTWLAVWVLCTIILSNTYIETIDIRLNASIGILFLGAILLLSTRQRWFYLTLCSIFLVFGYNGLYLWEKISPIWMVFPRTVTIPFIGLIVVTFLTKGLYEKAAIWILGSSMGEVVYSFILHGYGFQETIGDKSYLDIIAVEMGFLLLTKWIIDLKLRMDLATQELEKRKMGWTHE